jgi:hypothetical protein
MHFQRAWLYREFRQHMAANHRSNWSAQVMKLRYQLPPTIQQLCWQGGGPTGQQRGESKQSKEKQGKKKRRGPKARGAISIPILPLRGTSLVPFPTSPAMELLRDANAGTSVLHKIFNSGWWDWCWGSTLIFWQWPAGEQQWAARYRMEAYLQSERPSFKQRVKTRGN